MGVPLPLLLFPKGARLHGMLPSQLEHDPNHESISICLVYIYFYSYSYLLHEGHVMVFWNMGESLEGPTWAT
jgi:hypothetical protein